MRIAQIASMMESIPPKLYGGTERVVYNLTEALVALGHDVTLFASGDSETSAKLHPVWPRSLRLDPSVRDRIAVYMMMMETVRRHAGEFDVLHFHVDYWSLSLFSRQPTPFVTTMHGQFNLPEFHAVYAMFPDAALVAISDSQRATLPHGRFVATIPHGLPDLLRPLPAPARDYLAFLGRISPEKGPEDAIRIARACGMKLKMAAKIDEVDRDYYETRVRPLIEAAPGVDLVGEIGDAGKTEFLGNAAALLFPIAWPEPFGLVMIEAMACGTPVVAYDRGSVPEVMEHGTTGFVVQDQAGAIDAVRRLGELSHDAVRRAFERRFTARRMAEEYVAVYERLVAERRAAG